MSLIINNDVISEIRSKVGPCTKIVLSYTGNPALMDEQALTYLFRAIQEQSERGDLSAEHRLFTRLIISMDPPAHLPDAQKMQVIFTILGQIAEEAAPKTDPTPLELMEPLTVAQAATAMQDMGVVCLMANLYIQRDDVPCTLLTSRKPMREQAADGRSWLKKATPSLENESDLSFRVNDRATVRERLGTPFALVPSEIVIFKGLRTLDLSSSSLPFVPREIGCLLELELLDLSGNALQTLPNSCTALKKLERLNLRGNQLRSLPDLDLLPKLSSLDLSHNPRAILGAPCIQELENPRREPPCEVVDKEMRS